MKSEMRVKQTLAENFAQNLNMLKRLSSMDVYLYHPMLMNYLDLQRQDKSVELCFESCKDKK